MVVLWGELQGLFGGVVFLRVREGFLLKRRCWREGGWRVANSSWSSFTPLDDHIPVGWCDWVPRNPRVFFVFRKHGWNMFTSYPSIFEAGGSEICNLPEVMNLWQPWLKRRIPAPMPWWICGVSLISWKRWASESWVWMGQIAQKGMIWRVSFCCCSWVLWGTAKLTIRFSTRTKINKFCCEKGVNSTFHHL